MPTLIVCALAAVAAMPLDFDTDVLPVLTKAGCNAAACHGAAAGRGGFKLSLFAGDPASDYDAIARELEGRRLDFAHPENSLLIAKPTEELDHGGGQRFTFDSPEAKLLANWIQSGAPREGVRRLVKLKVHPRETLLSTVPATLSIEVTAAHNDGLRRLVAAQTVFLPADPTSVEVDGNGRLKVLRTGQHTVVVRYLHLVETVQITVPLNAEPIDDATLPRGSWIDAEVSNTLKELRMPAAPRADDATLLRRVTLDLTGRLPEPHVARAYLDTGDPAKYEKLVARLLASPEFADYWTYRLGKSLRIGAAGQDPAGAKAFHAWLRRHIETGTPLDQLATALITAEGDSHFNGPANFHRVAGDARTEAEYLTESLLGVRLRCANCHNHPLDRWTQDDYHGLAAVFARLDRGRNVRILPRGEVTHPKSGEPAVPRLPGERFLPVGQDGRPALATWLVARDNPYFAKAAVNRLWKALLGRGLIEPDDDLRATNPATHPALLDKLAADFQEHHHDLRHTLRQIAITETYARSGATNKLNRTDDRFYSHALDRPLDAEVLADALDDITGVPSIYGSERIAARAVLLVGSQVASESLDLLGRCGRADACSTADSSQRNLATRLHLINGPLVNEKITSAKGRLVAALESGRTNVQIVEQFYLHALSRLPRDDERAFWKQELDANEDVTVRRRKLEDFLWSLLTCRESQTNH